MAATIWCRGYSGTHVWFADGIRCISNRGEVWRFAPEGRGLAGRKCCRLLVCRWWPRSCAGSVIASGLQRASSGPFGKRASLASSAARARCKSTLAFCAVLRACYCDVPSARSDVVRQLGGHDCCAAHRCSCQLIAVTASGIYRTWKENLAQEA